MASKKTEAAAAGVMIASAVIMILTVAFILTPFSPVDYESYDLAVETSCSGEAVPVRVAYTIDEANLPSIRAIDVEGQWVAEDVPSLPTGAMRPAGGGEIDKGLLKSGRTNTESRARYVAPDIPGEWRLYSDIDVRGMKLWLPHIQEEGVYSDNTLKVLDEDDKRCEGKGLL